MASRNRRFGNDDAIQDFFEKDELGDRWNWDGCFDDDYWYGCPPDPSGPLDDLIDLIKECEDDPAAIDG